ncbi:MAG: DUF512 domain-containing protein [Lachnospiraceae bacterium]|nr:DUF512 domain-containing protein [Lachnospiraceae bacterium]
MKEHKISRVLAGSIAEELEIEPGDMLLTVNGKEMEDIFDYHYFVNDEEITLLIRKADGEEWELDIEKDLDEDLGIEFENGLMDDYKSCSNKCIFCFIDQMPPGMRETLYFKDDDSRLSFLQGNYVTLTNMKQADLDRIIRYHMGPINISVQTMNPKLRVKMLHNRFAGEALKKIDTLYEGGIEMNGQIVLCKNINDGDELDFSIGELIKYIPCMQSVSVVPVGLSKFREGLFPLEPFDKEDAIKVLDIIHKWQDVCMEKYGIHFVHASDELYLLAERDMPPEDNYDGYIQLENGVGMLRLLEEEFKDALNEAEFDDTVENEVTLVTGKLAAPTLEKMLVLAKNKFPNLRAKVFVIRNDFFGERITVSGLLTGQDIIAQIKEAGIKTRLLLPVNVLRSGEEVLLDDLTLTDLKTSLQVPIDIVKSSGYSLLEALIRKEV